MGCKQGGLAQVFGRDARHGDECGGHAVAEGYRPRLVQQQHVHVSCGLDGTTGHRQHVATQQPVHAGDADRRQQPSDGGGDETHQQGGENHHVHPRTVEQGHGLEGHRGEDEDERETRKKDVQGYLVGRLLTLGPFDKGYHPVEERLSRFLCDLDAQGVGDDRRTAGDGASVAARLTDDRCRLSGDGRLVHGGSPGDHGAVGGNDHARCDDDLIAALQGRGRYHLHRAVGLHLMRRGVTAGMAQAVCLCLASPFCQCLGEVGEQDGSP